MVALYDVNLFSTSASLSLRTPWLPQAKWIGWVSWFLMRLISERILCPVLRTNFSSSSFVLLDTTWASSTVVFTSWGSVDLMRTKSLRDYLKLPGATDRDWASLGISIMALPSCLGNIWASANGAAWGSFEVDGLPPGDHLLQQRSHRLLWFLKLSEICHFFRKCSLSPESTP